MLYMWPMGWIGMISNCVCQTLVSMEITLVIPVGNEQQPAFLTSLPCGSDAGQPHTDTTNSEPVIRGRHQQNNPAAKNYFLLPLSSHLLPSSFPASSPFCLLLSLSLFVCLSLSIWLRWAWRRNGHVNRFPLVNSQGRSRVEEVLLSITCWMRKVVAIQRFLSWKKLKSATAEKLPKLTLWWN